MSRNINYDNLTQFSFGLNPKINQPLDDRSQVSNYNDLFSDSTWGDYAYPGMLVVVQADGEINTDHSHDGLYRLVSNEDWEHNLPEHWEKIGAGEGGSTDISGLQPKTDSTADKTYLGGPNGTWVEYTAPTGGGSVDIVTTIRNKDTAEDTKVPSEKAVATALESYQEITDFVVDVRTSSDVDDSIVNDNGVAILPGFVEYDLTSQLDGEKKIFDIPSNVTKEPVFVFYSGLKLTKGGAADYTIDMGAKKLTINMEIAPDSDDGRHLTITVIE
jgi:hypothetical protein